jgi:hypothetical protein
MKLLPIFTSFIASTLLLAGCSQLSEPINPLALNKSKKQDAKECTLIYGNLCNMWTDITNCDNVVVAVSCAEDGIPGGGTALPDVYSNAQFRTRGTGGSLNFSVQYHNLSVIGITSTRQANAGSTIAYTFDGFNVSSEAGDGSFDFIAYITLVDSSLPTISPDRTQHYRLFISYDANNTASIATITKSERF